MDYGFAGFGVAEFFAGQARHGVRIVLERVNLGLEFVGFDLFLLQFVLQPQNVRAHPLVLPDQWQVPHSDEEEEGNNDQRCCRAGQFAPDAEVDVHAAS